MQFYFFRSPDKTYSTLFRSFAVKQNVATSRVLSIVTFILSGGILTSTLFINYASFAPNYSGHEGGIMLLIGSILYYLASRIVEKTKLRHEHAIQQFLSIAFSMVIVASGMWLSFLAQHNPKNTLVFLLISIFAVSVLWVLEAWESVIIMLLTLGAYYIGLQYFQTEATSLYQNYVVALIIVIMFFSVSRVIFSYHYNYFLQVKLVEQKNREINLANSTQKGILNIVSHDLRTPINNITSIVKLLQEEQVDETERNEYYNLILHSTRDANHIIHDLVDAASGQEKELQKTEVCLNDFLKAIYLEWQRRMPNGQTIVFNEPLGAVNAYIHANKMGRVLNNLVDNATKFTPANGTITIELRNLDNKIRISVNDNGIGIPTDLQPFLFDRFSSAGRSGLNGEKSYGLGLSICMQIVQEHDGNLLLESKEQEGSSFHIDIPNVVLA